MIKIYNGHGSSRIAPILLKERFSENGITADFISAAEIKNGIPQEETQLLVFGGQSVTQFKQALQPIGLKNIQNYVEKGGHYLGICAGGYFGVEQINFLGHDMTTGPYRKRAEGLGFFAGAGIGSLTQIAQRPFTGMSDSAAVTTLKTAAGEEFRSLYWGGAHFIAEAEVEDVRIIATLERQNEKTLVMGVQIDVGNNGGEATLLGYHPEISKANMERWILPEESIYKCNYTLFREAAKNKGADLDIDLSFNILLKQLNLTPKEKEPTFVKKPALQHS